MRKQLFISLMVLVMANAIAGTLLFYVYFPWSTDFDYQKASQEVRSDLLDLNLRLASNDYRFSKTIVDQASFDLNRNIKQKRPAELDLPKQIKEELSKERYKVYMENKSGPIGILKLNEQSYLILGPYYASYDTVNIRDAIAYLLILLVFNGFCLWLALSYLRSKLEPASEAIDQVAASVYLPTQEREVISNIINNTPQLAEKINQLQAEHKDNLRNQRDLMHAVAHEFRGPMARITFAIDLLTDNEDHKNKEQLKSDIESSLDELDSLVKEVLDYSRLKDGEQSLFIDSFNIRESINTCLHKVVDIYPNKTFETEVTPREGFNCQLDQKLIERTLLNLIRNAAKFSSSKVLIRAKASKEHLIVNVEDDGAGIPPGKRKRIFEPFTRLEHSRSRDSGGAGLGLAIVWGIANRHDGSIEVQDSEDLGGANFCLRLPLKVKV